MNKRHLLFCGCRNIRTIQLPESVIGFSKNLLEGMELYLTCFEDEVLDVAPEN